MAEDNDYGGCLSIIAIAILLIVCLFCAGFRGCTNYQTHVGTVQQSYVAGTGGDHKFQVIIERDDGSVEVFDNDDSTLNGKWNSADIHAKLKAGERVRIKTAGYRWHLFSWFPNVIEVEKVNEQRTAR